METREKISHTGMNNGFAIPHGKSDAVVTPQLAIATLAKPLEPSEWPSIDETNQVEAVFLIAVPEAKAGSDHLKILSQISTNLMNESFVDAIKNAKTADEVMNAMNMAEPKESATAPEVANSSSVSGKNVIAITACATGIAHTYMAAEALQKAAKEMGVNIKVEKQGANGIEDEISPGLFIEFQKSSAIP